MSRYGAQICPKLADFPSISTFSPCGMKSCCAIPAKKAPAFEPTSIESADRAVSCQFNRSSQVHPFLRNDKLADPTDSHLENYSPSPGCSQHPNVFRYHPHQDCQCHPNSPNSDGNRSRRTPINSLPIKSARKSV